MLRSRPLLVATTLALASVWLMYARTLGYSLYWDDVVVLRPWAPGDVAAAFVGPYRPWDPSVAFYRPLTSTYYAALSSLWGWQAAPMHVIALVGVSLLAVLTVLVVFRETGRGATALIAGVLTAAHPTLVTSTGPWIANQYQTFMLIALAAAVLIWQRHRRSGVAWWWRVTPWLIAAAWLKEDGLLLPLAFAAAHTGYARGSRDVPPLPTRAWVTLAGVTIALIAWRSVWLPTALGYGWREPADMVANLLRAPRYVLLLQVGPAAIAWPAMVAKAVSLGVVAWVLRRSRSTPGARLIVVGLVVAFFANLPLAMVSSEGRWHLVGWGAVLIVSGALGEWVARAPRSGWAVSCAVILALAVSANERIQTFAPCADDARLHYREMATVTELPAPLRDWLGTRDAACAAGNFEPFAIPMRDLQWGRR